MSYIFDKNVLNSLIYDSINGNDDDYLKPMEVSINFIWSVNIKILCVGSFSMYWSEGSSRAFRINIARTSVITTCWDKVCDWEHRLTMSKDQHFQFRSLFDLTFYIHLQYSINVQRSIPPKPTKELYFQPANKNKPKIIINLNEFLLWIIMEEALKFFTE